MESHVDVDALRRKANSLLQTLLQQAAGRSHEETACIITGLAFQDGNPVKELFAAAGVPAQAEPPSPKSTLKSRSSRSILRLRRTSKPGSADGKAPAPMPTFEEYFGKLRESAGASSSSKSATKTFPTSAPQRTTKPSASGRYQCIVCNELLSSKGVCKRHLEDQHVWPKQYKCEKCAETFTAKAKAKEHVKACGKGVFDFVTCRQDEKRIYACGFSGSVFTSMSRYVEHLLTLSERAYDDRPSEDMHRKLYALLSQPSMRPFVAEISSRVFSGSRDAWQRIRWSPDQLTQAIDTLEYALVHEDGTIEMSKHDKDQPRIQNVRHYLCGLLCEGEVRPSSTATMRLGSASSAHNLSRASSRSLGSTGTVTPTMASTSAPARSESQQVTTGSSTEADSVVSIMAPSVAAPRPSAIALQTFTDMKGKRHLSDHSRLYVPDRHPPGPPLPTSAPQMYDLSAQSSVHTAPIPTTSTISSAPHIYDLSAQSSGHAAANAVTSTTPSAPQSYDLSAQSSGHATPITNTSTTSLPYRPQYSHYFEQANSNDLSSRQLYTPSLATLTSDTATDSTLMSNYQDPELVTPMSYDSNMWQGGYHTLPYSLPLEQQPIYQMARPDYYSSPSAMPSRAPSTATDYTYVGDFSMVEQKTLNFGTRGIDQAAQFGTFLLDDDDANDSYGPR